METMAYKMSKALPESPDFARIGATAAENFEVPMPEGTIGNSCLEELC